MKTGFKNVYLIDESMDEPELVGFDTADGAYDLLCEIRKDADLPEDTNTQFFTKPASLYF